MAGLVGTYVTKSVYASGEGPGMRYFHHDSLGSVTAITNDAGAVIERLAYEPFGKRRFPNGTADPNNTLIGVTTERSFTDHEYLDELGLIHMNGRVYDPLLGRFMTADPSVPNPLNLQSFNRYSYALNNPLRIIDPSGFEGEEAGGDGCGGASDGDGTGEGIGGLLSNLFSLLQGGTQAGSGQDPVTLPSWACGPSYTYTGKGEQTPDGGSSVLQNFWNGITGQRGVIADKFDPSFTGDAGTFVRNVGRALPGVAYDVLTGTMLVVGVATLDPPAEGIGLRMLAARGAATVAVEGSAAGYRALVPMVDAAFSYGTVRTVAGYELGGNAGLVGSTYNVNIWGLYATGESQGLGALASALRAEAGAAGATDISISGNAIINPALANLNPAIAARYGFSFSQVNPTTIFLRGPVTP